MEVIQNTVNKYAFQLLGTETERKVREVLAALRFVDAMSATCDTGRPV
jgi:hypothetical protein